MRYVVIALIGALASLLSNRGIAVFNDGFRPIVGQYFQKQINRKELAAMSFAISFGLVIGFGIPTSIAASIILIHCLLLTTDIIGSFAPSDVKGAVISLVVGAAYGLGILFGLEFVVDLFSKLPYDFTGSLGKVSVYVTVAFAIFPAVATANQHGFKKGAITGIVTFIAYVLVKKYGIFTFSDKVLTLNPEGTSILAGMIMMIIFATSQKGSSTANQDLTIGFSENVNRIKKNWLILTIMGSLIALGTSLTIVAGDPASLALAQNGEFFNAGLAALSRAIGFIPLVFTTAIVTGVYGVAGCTFVFAIGMFLNGQPIFAALLGALVMLVEIFMINIFAKTMDKFPGVRDMGEHVRTSINKVLEISLLVGGIVAAEAMAAQSSGYSGIGALFVIGAYLLNKKSKKPIVDLAVGPVACIIFGIILNLLLVLGLISIPVK